MAGAINLTDVDFDQIKNNLINYLKSTDQFTDYDFEGSNLQVILNLIAYQAQLNSYSANMVANESFLSSASLRNNVVSNARMIGYLPISTKSSRIISSFQLQLELVNYPAGFPKNLQIQPGMTLSTRSASKNIIFNVTDPYNAAVSANGLCTFNDIDLYEGTYLSKKFVKNSTEYNQKFIIENNNIDTSSIRVEVQEDPNQILTSQYINANNLVETNSETKIYWIEEVDDGKYELVFGDGYFGNKLQDGAVINITYLISSGPEGNGIQGVSNFNFVGKVIDNTGAKITSTVTINSVTQSSGGSIMESVSSIKFRAPRKFASQNRCVISEDYETLIRQIYPAVEDIYVFGGEILEIPEYGRVYVVIKPEGTGKLTNSSKTYIKNSLNSFRVASLDIVIVDADVLNVEVASTVFYDDKQTISDASEVTSAVKTVLINYGDSSTVSKFGGAVRYSNVVGSIDDADQSITRNNTSLRMRRDMESLLNTAASYEVCFENEFNNISGSSISSVYSTGFTLINDTRTYYFEDDSEGVIYLFYLDDSNTKIIKDKNFGTVDYQKGEVRIGYTKPVTFSSTVINDSIIEIRAIPKSQDVFSKDTIYLNLDVFKSDIISVVDTQISGS